MLFLHILLSILCRWDVIHQKGASTFDSNTTESQVCELHVDEWLRIELGQTSLEERLHSGHSSLKRTVDKLESSFSKTDGNCFLKRKVSAEVNEIDRSVKRCAAERMMGQEELEENQQGDDDEEDTTACKEAGKKSTVDEEARDTEQAGGEFSAVCRKEEASQDRTLLCLTVGETLFGGMTHCEQVYRLQQEMISKGLLDDLVMIIEPINKSITMWYSN